MAKVYSHHVFLIPVGTQLMIQLDWCVSSMTVFLRTSIAAFYFFLFSNLHLYTRREFMSLCFHQRRLFFLLYHNLYKQFPSLCCKISYRQMTRKNKIYMLTVQAVYDLAFIRGSQKVQTVAKVDMFNSFLCHSKLNLKSF